MSMKLQWFILYIIYFIFIVIENINSERYDKKFLKLLAKFFDELNFIIIKKIILLNLFQINQVEKQ